MMADLTSMDKSSRVWVYQSNREFSEAEVLKLQDQLTLFASQWAAHGSRLAAGAQVYYNRFIVLAVDESQAGASGCSIDSSVRFIKQLEEEYRISLTDRMLFAIREDGKVKTFTRSAFEDAIEKGRILPETLVFNNLVKNKEEFDKGWETPLKQSWHAAFFSGNLFKADRKN